MTDNEFRSRIRDRFPAGLTGVFAVGGTRTTYILDKNRNSPQPGHIANYEDYADVLFDRYFGLIQMYFELGGQNAIVPILAYQRFYEKGETYAQKISELSLWLTNEQAVSFYKTQNVDPYFAGIDTLLTLPSDSPAHQLAVQLTEFQDAWPRHESHYKVIWEVAPIPLFSIWNAYKTFNPAEHQELEALLQHGLQQAAELDDLYKLLYKFYARAVYGTEIPIPDFYLGSNRNGDLKLRSMLPFALFAGGPSLRLFFTPYPSLFITRESLQNILNDLAFGKTLSSNTMDYADQYTPALVEQEYQRVMSLAEDPMTVSGLIRNNHLSKSE